MPIALGYFAVSFSLGIVARNVGMTPIQGMITSALCNASAGEYAGFTMIAAGAAYIEMAIVTLIANARYLLMSCAMSQRMDPDMPFFHRLLMAFDITDELFGITIARPGCLNPWYMYGAIALALPGWAVGTALGALAGNLMPWRLVSAFSVALYGMFLAIIIPPARKEPHPCRSHRHQLRGELPCGASAGDLIDLQRHENDHSDCGALIRSSDSLPASGRGQ